MGRLNRIGGACLGLILLVAIVFAVMQGDAVAQEEGHEPNRIYFGQDGAFYLNGAAFYNDANADVSASLEVLNAVTATDLQRLESLTPGTVTASKTVTVDANKNVGKFNDVGLGDVGELMFGGAVGGDVNLLWSDADATNHSFVIALDNTGQQAHITDKAAKATDWARSAGTHPELAIHSNTTPITDYLAIGNHDGTNASIDMVGGTGLDFAIDGVGALRLDDAAVSSFAGATDTVGQDVYLETQDAGGTATAARVGGLLNIKTGDGSAGASAVVAGAGGAATYTTGAGGGASGTAAGGASGALTLSSAAGGAHTAGGATGAGGAGGAVALTGGVGGATSNVGSDNGGAGAGVTITGGVGGLASAGTGDGGVGGAIDLTTGNGGTSLGGASGIGGAIGLTAGTGAAGAAAIVAGAGGAVAVATGPGGGASGTVAAGASGGLTLASAAGGAHTGGGATGAGGAGGAVALTAGAGGATSNVGASNGGNGASVTITGGVGGLASAGTGDGGAGGDITLTPGSGGTSAGAVAGAPGKVTVTTGLVHFSVQTLAMGDNPITMTLVPGTPTGTLLTGNILYADAESGGTENLLLPHEADATGVFLVIVNTGGETINVQTDAGGGLYTLETANTAYMTCDGTAWLGTVGIP
jgi:hypothetical protein